MPSIMCRCENLISLKQIPLPAGVFLVGEVVVDELYGDLEESLRNGTADANGFFQRISDVFAPGRQDVEYAVRCDVCGRLLVLGPDGDIAVSYARESYPASPN
jgi:hypothetical protein